MDGVLNGMFLRENWLTRPQDIFLDTFATSPVQRTPSPHVAVV